MTGMPYTITIEFDFPHGDTQYRPTVLTPTDRVDVVGTDFSTVVWKVAANISDLDGLAIVGLHLFSDAAKRNAVNLADVLDGVPEFGSDGSVTATIKSTLTGSLRTYYYDLEFAENTWVMPDFDPTLKIQPRSAEGGQHQSGA